jgi:hypothetical protein
MKKFFATGGIYMSLLFGAKTWYIYVDAAAA